MGLSRRIISSTRTRRPTPAAHAPQAEQPPPPHSLTDLLTLRTYGLDGPWSTSKHCDNVQRFLAAARPGTFAGIGSGSPIQ
jgi:hypothetical protein